MHSTTFCPPLACFNFPLWIHSLLHPQSRRVLYSLGGVSLLRPHHTTSIPLQSNMELELRESAGSMDLEALSTCLREFAVDQLKTNFLDPESSLKAVLSYVELPTQPDKYLSDFTWFDRSFPDSILMKHWVATYEFLSKIHKGEL